MGRPRKTQNQKQVAKKANTANMLNLEKMVSTELSGKRVEPVKKFSRDGLFERSPKTHSTSHNEANRSQEIPCAGPSGSGCYSQSSKKRVSSSTTDVPSNDSGPTGSFSSIRPDAEDQQSGVAILESIEPSPKKRTGLDASSMTSNNRRAVLNTPADDASVEDLFAGFCNDQATQNTKLIKEQQEIIDKKSEEIKILQIDNEKLRSLNMHLQEALVRQTEECTFTEVRGYPNADWLLSISQNSGDSDYLFIKELVFHLFPEGVGNATPTGRPSNNPKGRNKDPEAKGDEAVPIEKLDPQKVKYMKDRLYERRRILQEPAGVAVTKSKMVNRHIANVIANNRALRNNPKKQQE